MPQMKYLSTQELQRLRRIDALLDESERIAASPGAVWIDEEDFWAETETPAL